MPADVNGHLSGAVLLDIESPATHERSVVIDAPAGTKVELAAYEGSHLQLNNQGTRLTTSGITAGGTLPVQTVHISARPQTMLNGGHRVMIASLPLAFGANHEGIATVATATAAEPTFLNTWEPVTLAVAALAAAMLIASILALFTTSRSMARDLATDPLTGLRNRRTLMVDLEHACRASTEQAPASGCST